MKKLLLWFMLGSLSISFSTLSARELRTVPDDILECDMACIQVAQTYALLNQDVYEDHATYEQAGWQRGAYPIEFGFVQESMTFDDDTWVIADDDGLHMGLYMHHERREVVLAIRGTEFDSLDDLLADIQQLFGAIPEQYENALTAVETLQPYIAQVGYSLTLTGHSLGGGIAQYVANSLNLPAITFNSAPISKEVENDSFARQYPEGLPEQMPIPNIYNVVFRAEGGWWPSYDIVADSYSSANSGGLLGLSFALITQEGMDYLELHSLDQMVIEMQRHLN